MKNTLVLLISVCLFMGCSSTKYTYREIQKDKSSYNESSFKTSSHLLQKALVAALLSKKFVVDVDDLSTMTVSARRFFAKGRKDIVVVIQGKIVSLNDQTQRLFLNAVQTTERSYVADRTRFLLWIIPLPGGGGKVVSNAKESEMAIEDQSFYKDIFDTLQAYL